MNFPTEDLYTNIARGLVKNTSVRNIFGYNSAIPVDGFIAAWELPQAYVYPSTATVMDVSSDSLSDTSVTIRVIGLDANYEIIFEDVVLNGTTVVQTTQQFFRINDIVTISGNAIGNVTISNSGITYGRIRAGEGRNQASIFTVPANHEFYLFRIDAFASVDSATAKLGAFRNFVITSTGVELRVAETRFYNTMHIDRKLPFRYEEKTDIQMQIQAIGQVHHMSVFAEGILMRTTV